MATVSLGDILRDIRIVQPIQTTHTASGNPRRSIIVSYVATDSRDAMAYRVYDDDYSNGMGNVRNEFDYLTLITMPSITVSPRVYRDMIKDAS